MDELAAQLVLRAKAGDETVAPLLVSLYGESLLGFARSHAPDLSDADRESIVEKAVEAGVRSLGRFDETKGTLVAWFRQQIRYRTLDWRRGHPREGELPESYIAPDLPEQTHDPALFDALSRVIQALSHEDQKIIALRDAEGLAYEEIASRLNISTPTARKRHSRAKERLYGNAKREALLSAFIQEEEV